MEGESGGVKDGLGGEGSSVLTVPVLWRRVSNPSLQLGLGSRSREAPLCPLPGLGVGRLWCPL